MKDRRQERWIRLCRKAIRFATKHNSKEIITLWNRTDNRLENSRPRNRSNKYHNKTTMCSLAICYKNGRIDKNGFLNKVFTW